MLWRDGCWWRCNGTRWNLSSYCYGVFPFKPFPQSQNGHGPYYNVELKQIRVAGKALRLDPKIFYRKYGTVLDSGATYTYFADEAFIAFRNAIMSHLQSLKQIGGRDPNFKDICFSDGGSDVPQLNNTFPVVDMVFGNGQKFSLSPENYWFRELWSAILW